MPTITTIDSKALGLSAYLRKIWSFRSMLLLFSKRDLQVKYAQTFLGIGWALLQPLTGLIIFTLFFGKLIKIDTGGVPYPLFAFTGMVSWFLFSQILVGAGLALQEGQNLIKRIYFPKMTLLLSKVLVSTLEFLVSLTLLILLMLALGRFPSARILYLPLFVLFNVASGLSIAIWLSALTIRHRDFHHIIPYLVNFGIWLTPVFYPATLIPRTYQWVLYLNPMAATIAGFRWCLAGMPPPDPGYLLSLIPVFLLLGSGLNYFRKVESSIADYI